MKSMRINIITLLILIVSFTAICSVKPCCADQDKFYEIAKKVGEESGVPPYIIMAVIKQESDFNPLAISESGAIGLMQIMIESAEEVGVPGNQLFDPYRNVLAGTRYLKKMHQKFGNWGKAFAAYYIGPGRLERNELKPRHWEKVLAYLKGIDKKLKHFRSVYDVA